MMLSNGIEVELRCLTVHNANGTSQLMVFVKPIGGPSGGGSGPGEPMPIEDMAA